MAKPSEQGYGRPRLLMKLSSGCPGAYCRLQTALVNNNLVDFIGRGAFLNVYFLAT